MFLSDLLQLVLFVAQQLGVLVAVGAQTSILVMQLRALHNPALHEHEERLSRGARHLRSWGLGFIVLSGALISLQTTQDVLFAPAFLSKWLLLGAALAFSVVSERSTRYRFAYEGALGAVWYAILIIHIAAPVATWGEIGALVAAWMVFFAALWAGTGAVLRGTSLHLPAIHISLPKITVPKISLPKVSLPKRAPAPKPVAPPAFVLDLNEEKELPPGHAIDPESLPAILSEPPVPIVMKIQEYIEEGLPHIRVMPRTQEEAQTHFSHA